MSAPAVTPDQLNAVIVKRQRRLLGQIATRQRRIAALQAECDELRRQLVRVGEETALQWAIDAAVQAVAA